MIDTLDGLKIQIGNIMNDVNKQKSINYINNQLKNINAIINNAILEIKKNISEISKLNNLYKSGINHSNKNVYKEELDKNKDNEINNTKLKILEEYKFIKEIPFTELPIEVDIPDKNNVFEWKITFKAPKDTLYEGGLFFLKMTFPKDFPKNRPIINFLTPIYHVNVNFIDSPHNPLGYVSNSIWNWWNPKYKIRYLLNNLYMLFYLPNPESPWGLERADEFNNNIFLYEKKVKYYTMKYAFQINASNCYNDKWDFSDNIDINDNLINVIFEIDGINRKILQCKKDEYRH